MSFTTRAMAVALFLSACAESALAQPNSQPLPEPLPMGVPYVYQPGNNYWYAPATPWYASGSPYTISTSAGTYYTVYPASRPVVVATPAGAVSTMVPTTPVVAGPTWALTPVSYTYSSGYPFASSGPVFGRYAWDYTGFYTGFGWYGATVPHYPFSYQYPTLTGRVWMGFGW